MKEFVTANGRIFECSSITTGINSITLGMENQDADDVEAFFRDVTELTVSFEKENGLSGYAEGDGQEPVLDDPHGIYTEPKFSLAFESVTKFEDGSIAVTMHIKSEIERRLDALEAGQELQNGAIDELANVVGQ